MKWIFSLLFAVSFFMLGWQQLHWDPAQSIEPLEQFTQTIFSSSEAAVQLALKLIGVMAFFLGLIKIAEDAGVITWLSRLIAPLLRPLFPQIPQDHPAFGSILMNFSANILGAGNAATPFGIQAMQHLQSINEQKERASDAMIMFLVINTSSLTLIPSKVIALRQAAGSVNAAAIIPTTILATLCSTLAGIVVTCTFQRILKVKFNSKNFIKLTLIVGILATCFSLATLCSAWILPTLVTAVILYALFQKVDVYSSFIAGAKQGFEVAIKIIPYLIAILVALGVLRASGAFEALLAPLSLITSPLGFPTEALPMALLRPFSGSGSLGVLADTLSQTATGPDTFVGQVVSTMMGSTETTFYVLAVYFGAIGVQKLRYAIVCALFADFIGAVMSVVAVSLLL